MKQKRDMHRVVAFLAKRAPRASSPREKERLARDICMNCFFALQSESSDSFCWSGPWDSASVRRVKHWRAIRIMALVRKEMKLTTKIPECHLILLRSWLTFRIMNTPLRQMAAMVFRPKTFVAIDSSSAP
jgi:hypothetical protein